MITKCRLCHSENLTSVIDLGNQHLSDFRADKNSPDLYPLNLLLCLTCSLAQLSDTAPRDLMYHDGYGYKSGVNEKLRENLRDLVKYGDSLNPNAKTWLDIASNDGTLLSYVSKSIFRVGVDPVSKFKNEASAHANLIIDDYFPPQEKFTSKFDIITASFMFYDVDDPNLFVSEIKKVLSDSGILIVQQNYLLSMLEFNTFDNISHEHIEYYSMTSMKFLMESHDLEIFDAHQTDTNGGSFVCAVAKRGSRHLSNNVIELQKQEKLANLTSTQPYESFAKNIDYEMEKLTSLVEDLHSQGKTIYIYGASTRGSTIWQKAKIDNRVVAYAVERQEAKIGKYFSAIGVPIISEVQMREAPPDYLLIGPWFLREQFIARESKFLQNGGKMIFPLPKVEIV